MPRPTAIDAEEIERRFRCGYYTFEQILEVYGLTRDEAMEIIKPALNDGCHANFDPRMSPQDYVAKLQYEHLLKVARGPVYDLPELIRDFPANA